MKFENLARHIRTVANLDVIPSLTAEEMSAELQEAEEKFLAGVEQLPADEIKAAENADKM